MRSSVTPRAGEGSAMMLVNRKHNTRSTAAAFPSASCVVGALLISINSPAGATECRAYKGNDRAYWSWREIDHRRCWYRGDRGLNKHMLHWPAATAEPVRAARPSPPRPSPPPVIAAD